MQQRRGRLRDVRWSNIEQRQQQWQEHCHGCINVSFFVTLIGARGGEGGTTTTAIAGAAVFGGVGRLNGIIASMFGDKGSALSLFVVTVVAAPACATNAPATDNRLFYARTELNHQQHHIRHAMQIHRLLIADGQEFRPMFVIVMQE